ncbi:MAG: hypothetical protein ACM3U0_00485 [archaeon]
MEDLRYKRINWQIELLNLILISAEIVMGYQTHLFSKLIPGLIIQICSYLLLSLIYYFVLSPKVLFHKTRAVVPIKMRNIPAQESLRYAKRGILCFNSTKLLISFLIGSLAFIDKYYHNSYNAVILLIILLSVSFYLIILFTKNIASAKGYVVSNSKELLRNFVFYYNPADRRTSVDKPLGMGSTINLATKDGKIVFGVILAIPVVFIIFLLAALALAGKL